MFLIDSIKNNIVTTVWVVASTIAFYLFIQLFTNYDVFRTQPKFLLGLKCIYMYSVVYLNLLVFINYSLYLRHGKKGIAPGDFIFASGVGIFFMVFFTLITVDAIK